MHQRRHPDLRRSFIGVFTFFVGFALFAFHEQMLFEFLTAATLETGAIAAQGNKAIDQHALGKDVLQASAESGGHCPQSRSWNAG